MADQQMQDTLQRTYQSSESAALSHRHTPSYQWACSRPCLRLRRRRSSSSSSSSTSLQQSEEQAGLCGVHLSRWQIVVVLNVLPSQSLEC